MRSIVYAGHDFSELCSAEVVARSANPIIADALQVPGRAGAMLVTGYLPPVDVTVRLFFDAGFAADVVQLAELRHTFSFWLCAPGGGNLVLPDEPEHTYHDALLVSAGAWSKLFSDWQCEITFTLFDPIAYGHERIERLGRFDVGDTVAVIDTSRDPEWRLTARVVRRVRTFGDSVLARVTIGTVQPVDYASVSALAADVAALQDDVAGIDGNLTTAASVTVVENTVTEAIDELDELGEVEF